MCKYAQMDWSHLEYFLAVARAGSLSAAAKRLNVRHSTVARRLDKLEQELQIRLFDRLSRGYRLTEHGLALQQQAMKVEGQFNQINRLFSGREGELSGRLKITKPSGGVLNMAHMLTQFHRLYPNIDMHLTASSTLSDLTSMEADVALRFTEYPPQNMIARKLAAVPFYLYASQEYLNYVGGQDPSKWEWLIWQEPGSELDVEEALREKYPDVKIILRSNSNNEIYQAVCAGMGVSLLTPLRLPKEHKLIRLLPEQYQVHMNLWLLSHPDLRNRARVNVFKEFMIEQMQILLETKSH